MLSALRRVAAFIALPVIVVACTTSAAEEPPPEVTTIDHFTERDARTVERYYDRIETAYAWAVMTGAWNDVVTSYVAAVYEAEQARLAAEAAARRPTASSSYSGSSVGGACGGSMYDYVIDEESGGDPNARNPSGAWGCYQIMPGTWAGAGCNDLGVHGSASVEAQAACADRLSASAWAASQG